MTYVCIIANAGDRFRLRITESDWEALRFSIEKRFPVDVTILKGPAPFSNFWIFTAAPREPDRLDRRMVWRIRHAIDTFIDPLYTDPRGKPFPQTA